MVLGHSALCAAAALAAPPAAPKTAVIPEAPVAAESLAPEKLAAFRAPADVQVAPAFLTATIGPMSFTSFTEGSLNRLNDHGGFEPIAYRPLVRPARDSAKGENFIHVSDKFGADYPDGFFDGAAVRVYQIVDGKMTLIRRAQVPSGGHGAIGWKGLKGFLHAAPDNTSCRFVFEKTARLNAPYWITVRAVYEGGIQGPDAEPVLVTPRETSAEKQPAPFAANLDRRARAPVAGVATPAAPAGLKAALAGGVAELSWNPVPAPGLVGYRVLYSPRDPKTFHRPGIALDSREPRPDLDIQAGDIVFLDQLKYTVNKADEVDPLDWNRTDFWTTGSLPGLAFWPDEDPRKTWALVPHPGPLPPEFTNPGRTCFMMRNDTPDLVGMMLRRLGAGDRTGFYKTLRPVRHTFTAWVRGAGSLKLQFAGPYGAANETYPWPTFSKKSAGETPIPSVSIPVSNEWRRVSVDFTPPGVPKSGLGAVYLSFAGPGQVYIDDMTLFEADQPANDFNPVTLAALRDSGMSLMRTHELVRTYLGYTLDSVTNPAGGLNYSGGRFRNQTAHSLLRQMKLAGTFSPWLQMEMCLDEQEWQGLVEWLAAPYDPAKDTPQTKPWAAKRHRLGQTKPWLDEFPRFALELSNEIWNPIFLPYGFTSEMKDSATGRVYPGAACGGLFFEYVVGQLRKSPWWTPAVEAKAKFVIGGWGTGNYGVLARENSPSAHIVTAAAYSHNSGLGDPKTFTDFKLLYQLQWGLSGIEPSLPRVRQNLKNLARKGLPTEWGMYEFGPAYFVMPGDPAAAKEVDQRLARGISAGVYVLDAVLRGAQAGETDQAFFTFEHQIGPWGSHTTLENGGHAYPLWKGMTLFNRFGTGRFLDVRLPSAPKWDFPEYEAMDNMSSKKRPALPAAPLVSAYAVTKGDRVSVFVLSRKLDNFPVLGDPGFTPVTLRLPFASAKKLTLHKLVGDPRVDDRFEEHVREQVQEIDASNFRGTLAVNQLTGADARGLPPASIYVYVFEGADTSRYAEPPEALIAPVAPPLVGQPVALKTLKPLPAGATLKWTVAGVGEFTSPAPAVTFTAPGSYDTSLEVRSAEGLVDRDTVTLVAGLADASGRVWSSTSTPERSPGTVALSGNDVRIEAAAYSLGLTEPLYGPFSLAATVEKPELPASPSASASKTPPSAGFTAALESEWASGWRPQMEDSVRVYADGSVRLGGNASNTTILLPAGAVAFPAQLRLTVQDRTATFSVKIGDTWRDVHVRRNFSGNSFPFLTINSGTARGAAAVRFRDVSLAKP